MKKIKIENEKNIYRDSTSNAILFDNFSENEYERRKRAIQTRDNEINTMKEEIKEIKDILSEIRSILGN